jgi:hypothetical protein
VARLADHYPGTRREDRRGLVEDDLRQPGILLAELACLCGWLDVGEVTDATLGLGHHLVRDDDDVGVVHRGQQRRHVVSGPDLGQPGDCA